MLLLVAADVGKKEEKKNFFALSTYFHGRTQLHHSGQEKILKIVEKWVKGKVNTNFLGFLTNFHGIYLSIKKNSKWNMCVEGLAKL